MRDATSPAIPAAPTAPATPAHPTTIALLEAVADACVALDADGRLTYVNGAAAMLLGCPRDAAIGQPAAALFPPTEGDALGALLRDAATGGQPGEAEVRLGATDRRYSVRAWCEGGATLAVCREVGAVPVGTDLTDAVRAEEAARRNERWLRLIVDSAGAAIRYIDAEQRYRFSNRVGLEWFGLDWAQVEGRTVAEVLGAEAYALLRPHLERALRGETARFRLRMPDAAHSRNPLTAGNDHEITYTPDRDETGRVRGVVAAATDVSALVRVQEAMQRGERQLRLILDSTSAGVILFDREERCRYANPTALAGFGRAQAAVIGRPFAEVIGPAMYALVGTELARALRGESVQFFVRVPEGPETADLPIAGRDFIMAYTPEVDEAGAVQGVVAVNTDISDHIRAEDALRRSEERYRLALAAASGLIYEYDLVADTLVRSPGLLDLLGFRPDEASPAAAWWNDRIHPEERDRALAVINARIADDATPSYGVEYRIRHREGHYVHVWDRAVLLRDATGRAVRAVGNTLDITERTRAEEALRGSEERFRLAAAAVAGLLYDNDRWTGRVDYSPGLFDLTGYRPDEVPANANWWTERTHPDDVPQARAAFAAASADPAALRYSIEYRVRHRDGHDVWAWDRGYFVRDEAGAVIRSVGNVVDITERKRADEETRRLSAALHTQLRKFDAMVASVPDFFYTFDLQGRFTYTNQPLLDLLRTTLDEIIGKNFHDLGYPPELADRLQRQIAEVIATHGTVRDETPFTSASGPGYYEYIFAPLLAADGTVEAVAGTTRDITEQKRAAAEMRQLQTEAVRLSDEFLSSVSHELRTPLTAIMAALGMLDDTGGERLLPAEHGLLRNARRNTAHLTRLVDDLVVFNQVKEHRLQLEIQPLHLRTLVEEVVSSMDILLDRKGQTVALDLDDLPFVAGDNRRLRQVFVNLLDNAYRHTPHGTAITVRGWADNDGVVVSIEDTGVGIPESQRARIFERLYVGGAITSGTGLGLAIARSIVELHGGAVWVEAASSGGAAFRLRLPLSDDATSD